MTSSNKQWGKTRIRAKSTKRGRLPPPVRPSPAPWDARQSNRDFSQDREARDAALAKTIAEAVAREMAKAHVQ